MSLSPGTRLGPYEILAPIGAGGMGEVYRASDSRLNREVAIKVSASQFTERFAREAHAIAALNHPNICQVYDIGANYLVMELVEGSTLADRIQQGAIPIEEALLIARQIGEALEAAHEKRIIHRDLKPGNIKIRPDGTVKVLDFGLAKMAEEVAPDGNPENSPTLTLELATSVGAIMGTAAYMAPEQARGKPVDKRADIWAFGVVLYEMLTGQRLFGGETISDTLASVLKEEPQWDRVPVRTLRLLRSCLERDPRQRLRDIGDAWRQLDEAPPARPAAPLHSWIGWVAAALLAAAGLPLAFVHFRERPPVTQPVRFQIPAPASSLSFTLSPDGRQLAYLAPGPEGFSVWVRALDSLEPRLLPGTAGVLAPPFWSPDSRFLAFEVSGKLKKVDPSGGLPEIICDSPTGVLGGSWNREGVIIFGAGSGIQRVPEAGGAVTPVTVARQGVHFFPSFLEDGRHFIYLSAKGMGGGTEAARPSDWSRDNRFLLYATLDSRKQYDLWALSLTGSDRNPISIARTEFNERQGQFSPDTRWVAYVSDESGRPEVYVQPFPPSSSGSNKFPISQSGGEQPRWRRDGKELFYFSLDGKLMAVDVTSSPAFHAGIPKHLFSPPLFYGDESAPYVFRWDVAADGRRFLIDTIASTSDPVTVVLNWTAGLKK